MVPLLAVIFSLFSIFPIFEKLKEEVEDFVFRNFVPELGEVVKEQILRLESPSQLFHYPSYYKALTFDFR